MYCYDPFSGALYRDSEAAKKALVDLFDMSYGEGGVYADLDEAYAAMTGYDMEYAQELMAIAADKAIEAGIWDGEAQITLDIRLYNSDTIYVQMYNYFLGQLTEAVKGSKFEGKITMTMTPDSDYYNTMYSGGADMIFTTWGGASMDPFGILARCYCDDSTGAGNQMEIGFDTSKVMLTYDFGGEIGWKTYILPGRLRTCSPKPSWICSAWLTVPAPSCAARTTLSARGEGARAGCLKAWRRTGAPRL